MKKLLILILIVLLLLLTGFLGIHGLKMGNIEILGIQAIKQRNEELDEKIQEAAKLAQKDYEQAISTVKTDVKKLETERQKYEDMTAISNEGEIQTANQIEKYEIETLWVKLGNHATSEGVVMKMEVTKGGNTTEDTYNLKFTVSGSYIAITDFISDIENDSYLGFKIEEFKMVPGSSSADLQATFVCKGILIKDVQESSTITTTTENINNENNTDSNTNSTNTTNSANTTNSVNTTNSTNETNNTNTNSAQ